MQMALLKILTMHIIRQKVKSKVCKPGQLEIGGWLVFTQCKIYTWREVGRVRYELERSLEITDKLEWVDRDRSQKKVLSSLSRLSSWEFKLTTNKTLGYEYDMRVELISTVMELSMTDGISDLQDQLSSHLNNTAACKEQMYCIGKMTLNVIGKGFVLFKISSSPASSSAFYIIKPTCIWWLVFKVNKCLKNYRKLQTRTFVYVAEWWRHLSGRIQTSSLFVPKAPLNLIFGTLSA